MAVNNFTNSASRIANSALQRTPNARNLQRVTDTVRKGVDEGARRIQESSQAAQGRATVALAKTKEFMEGVVKYFVELCSRAYSPEVRLASCKQYLSSIKHALDILNNDAYCDDATKKNIIGGIIRVYNNYTKEFKQDGLVEKFKTILDSGTGVYKPDIKNMVMIFIANTYKYNTPDGFRQVGLDQTFNNLLLDQNISPEAKNSALSTIGNVYSGKPEEFKQDGFDNTLKALLRDKDIGSEVISAINNVYSGKPKEFRQDGFDQIYKDQTAQDMTTVALAANRDNSEITEILNRMSKVKTTSMPMFNFCRDNLSEIKKCLDNLKNCDDKTKTQFVKFITDAYSSFPEKFKEDGLVEKFKAILDSWTGVYKPDIKNMVMIFIANTYEDSTPDSFRQVGLDQTFKNILEYQNISPEAKNSAISTIGNVYFDEPEEFRQDGFSQTFKNILEDPNYPPEVKYNALSTIGNVYSGKPEKFRKDGFVEKFKNLLLEPCIESIVKCEALSIIEQVYSDEPEEFRQDGFDQTFKTLRERKYPAYASKLEELIKPESFSHIEQVYFGKPKEFRQDGLAREFNNLLLTPEIESIVKCKALSIIEQVYSGQPDKFKDDGFVSTYQTLINNPYIGFKTKCYVFSTIDKIYYGKLKEFERDGFGQTLDTLLGIQNAQGRAPAANRDNSEITEILNRMSRVKPTSMPMFNFCRDNLSEIKKCLDNLKNCEDKTKIQFVKFITDAYSKFPEEFKQDRLVEKFKAILDSRPDEYNPDIKNMVMVFIANTYRNSTPDSFRQVGLDQTFKNLLLDQNISPEAKNSAILTINNVYHGKPEEFRQDGFGQTLDALLEDQNISLEVKYNAFLTINNVYHGKPEEFRQIGFDQVFKTFLGIQNAQDRAPVANRDNSGQSDTVRNGVDERTQGAAPQTAQDMTTVAPVANRDNSEISQMLEQMNQIKSDESDSKKKKIDFCRDNLSEIKKCLDNLKNCDDKTKKQFIKFITDAYSSFPEEFKEDGLVEKFKAILDSGTGVYKPDIKNMVMIFIVNTYRNSTPDSFRQVGLDQTFKNLLLD